MPRFCSHIYAGQHDVGRDPIYCIATGREWGHICTENLFGLPQQDGVNKIAIHICHGWHVVEIPSLVESLISCLNQWHVRGREAYPLH